MQTLERTGTETKTVSSIRDDKRLNNLRLSLEEKIILAIIILICLVQSLNPASASLPFLSWTNLRWGLCILLVVHGLFKFYVLKQGTIPYIGSAIWYCIGFLAVALFSGLSENWLSMVKRILLGPRLSSLALFLSGVIFFTPKLSEKVISMIVKIGLLLSILGIIEFFNIDYFVFLREQFELVLSEKRFEYVPENRIALLWANAPQCGTFFALLIPLCLYQLKTAKSSRALFFKSIQLSLIGIALLMTGSRGPISSAILGIILFIFWGKGGRRWHSILIMLMLVLTLSWWILGEPFISTKGAFTRLLDYSQNLEGRLELWRLGWNQYISRDWFWGIGYGEWWNRYGWHSFAFYKDVRSLHGFYVQVLIETGLKGVLIELLFLYVLFLKTVRVRETFSIVHKNVTLRKRTFFLSILIMTFCSVFDLPLGTPPFMHLYFAFGAMLWRD